MAFWLMKSEPDTFSIDELAERAVEPWNGVRNYQARNFMRAMQVGDLVLFYHSNAAPSGIVGLARISGAARPDPTQFDPQSEYFDAKSVREEPRWDLVDVAFVEKFAVPLPLADIKADVILSGMTVAQKGSRLSVTPVDRVHVERVLLLAGSRYEL